MMTPQGYMQITYALDGPLAVVSLNRPRVANAISRGMTRELDDAFRRACVCAVRECTAARHAHHLGKKLRSG